MIYKYYTCDTVVNKGVDIDTGCMISKFYIFTSPIKCLDSMRRKLDEAGFKDCKMKNFRRVK